MESTEEGKILNDLIEVNIDACSFYRGAANAAGMPIAEKTFHSLEMIHVSIVEGLGLAAYRNGNASTAQYMSCRKAPVIFRRLGAAETIPLDRKLVCAVENAENRCSEILAEAIDSDDISMDIKMHVLEAVTILQGRHEYIHKLKDLTSISGRAA
jgi:hypothetical protein